MKCPFLNHSKVTHHIVYGLLKSATAGPPTQTILANASFRFISIFVNLDSESLVQPNPR